MSIIELLTLNLLGALIFFHLLSYQLLIIYM